MGELVLKLPDVGEGVAEAELVEWHVKVGDLVRADAPLAAVMTDKATVEIPAPADGEILWLSEAAVGDRIAVGSELVRMKVAGETGDPAAKRGAKPAKAKAQAATTAKSANSGIPSPQPDPLADLASSSGYPAKAGLRGEGQAEEGLAAHTTFAKSSALRGETPIRSAPMREAAAAFPREGSGRPLASPAVRLRAKEAGIDLRQVPGSGPAGRISHEDLDAFIARGPGTPQAPALRPQTAIEEIKLTGLRRKIAEKMSAAHAHIPHITYVEETDVTALEELRAKLNSQRPEGQPKLTLLPFLMRAMVRAIAEQPRLNALFDDEAGVLRQSAGVHIGIAVQTRSGLMVPVVRHAEARDLWASAAEVARLSSAARAGTASRDELSGSTITISSLGALGGIVSTPIINYPEVAIVGVNKIVTRPVWDGRAFAPRQMMNLSSSFDHRIVDGFEAAVFVQRIKALLETPALIFMDG
jgi:2-oxoisovalerate dehydrogenase E2 component (dihydrolipoyl transacylase)